MIREIKRKGEQKMRKAVAMMDMMEMYMCGMCMIRRSHFLFRPPGKTILV